MPSRGEWTTQPVNGLWNIAITQIGSKSIFNQGQRKPDLGLKGVSKVSLLIPDNGSLGQCPELTVQILGHSQRVYERRLSCRKL
jgi:hypothetical protein